MRRLLASTLVIASLAPAAQAEFYAPGSKADPRVRATDYLAENKQYFSATSALILIQNENPEQQLAPDYFWKLADDTLSFGMQERAAAIYREVPPVVAKEKDKEKDRDAADVAKARLRLADFLYQRGYQPEAVEGLMAMRDNLPQPLVPDWQGALARPLMAQGQFGEAAEVLTDLDNARKQDAYTRYNLGVSLIQDGRAGQGVNVLDRMGRMRVTDEETLALRDKANVGLGYHFLRTQQGGTAIPIFERVRSVGPFSNRALLGLGWAYLAPEGTKQKKAEVGDEPKDIDPFGSFSTIGVILRPGFLDTDIYKRAGLRPFRLDAKDADQEAALKRALVPWVELMSRDPMDPAVQEAYLAVPFSLDRIGAHGQAREYYEKAIAALEQTRKNLDYAGEQVRNGRMVAKIIDRDPDSEAGWQWKLYNLPAAPETYYLQNLIAENRYQEVLKNYRDVLLMERNLDAWSERLDRLQQEIATRGAEDANPALLFQRAKAQRGTGRDRVKTVAPPLTLAPALIRAPEYAEPLPDSTIVIHALKLDEGAPKFDGPAERIVALKARIAADKPRLKAAETALAKLLQRIALDELVLQRKKTEKYLIEARFALARIYDRTPKGEVSP